MLLSGLLLRLSLVHAVPVKRAGEVYGWSPVGAEPNGTMAIQALVERRLPDSFHNLFEFQLDESLDSEGQFDTFDVQTQNTSNRVRITASSTSGLSRGLLTYLRDWGGDIYWTGDMFTDRYLDRQLTDATSWNGSSWAEWRYLFSTATFSYTMAWWDWPRWEYLLDWASLHGINLPLAMVGQEYIWAEVFRDFGVPEEEILSYFAGPAFEAFGRMGSVHGSWGGRVTYDWVGKRWILQRQIITRMVALGMTPVLPAFNGFVPDALQSYIGGPQLVRGPKNGDIPDDNTYNTAIDPTWETWSKVQTAFLEKQRDLYGGWTAHYYSVDLYTTLEPPSYSPDYLRANTRFVIDSLRQVDPQAVWVMSGGIFINKSDTWTPDAIEGLLSGAEDDEMIVLDLASEALPAWNSTDSFFGKRWIWNTLVNYGGADGMYGSVWHYSSEVVRARDASPSMVGVGLTMEGMSNNEVVFELALDSPWRTDAIDPAAWSSAFAVRRYATQVPDMTNATVFIVSSWRRIIGSIYNSTDPSVQGVPKSPLELIPAAEGLLNRTGRQPTKLSYNSQAFMGGCLDLLAAGVVAPALEDVRGYNYDMCQCARQVQLDAGELMYRQMMQEWRDGGNASGIQALGVQIVQNLQDIDRVVSTNYDFMFAAWISDARKWSDDPVVKDFYEYQARNQISSWGPLQPGGDEWRTERYASRQWAGLLGEFYPQNWNIFVEYLTETSPADYNQSVVNERIRQYTLQWEQQKWGARASERWGDSGERLLEVIANLRSRWAPWLESL